MNIKNSHKIKLIYSVIIFFILINLLMVSPSFALNNTVQVQTSWGATILKICVVSAQILASGYYAIDFTMLGIRYFMDAAASDKAHMKNKMIWEFFKAVLTFLAMFLFSYLVGLT